MQSTKSQLDNLKKGPRFTSENASEYGRRGQAKSVEAKKLRKRLALLLNQMTEKKITDEEAKEKLEELGFDTEELRNDAVIAVSLFQSAAKGDLNALDRMIEWIDTGIDEQGAKQMSAEEEALALVRKNYLENISSTFGAITVYALKHRFTHYEASGGRGSAKSTWASLTVIRLLMEHPDVHALVLRKVANTLRDSVYAQYLWSIGALGVSEFWEARKSPLELIYLPTGQKILFRGADDHLEQRGLYGLQDGDDVFRRAEVPPKL